MRYEVYDMNDRFVFKTNSWEVAELWRKDGYQIVDTAAF